MSTKRERIGGFRDLLGNLAQVPKAELEREAQKHERRKAKKQAKKRNK